MVGRLLSVLAVHWAGVVDLSDEEKEWLEAITTKGESKARRLRRAHILLLADEGLLDKEIARAMNAAVTTVERTRKRFVEEGLEAALSERSRPGARRRLDGHQEALEYSAFGRNGASPRWVRSSSGARVGGRGAWQARSSALQGVA